MDAMDGWMKSDLFLLVCGLPCVFVFVCVVLAFLLDGMVMGGLDGMVWKRVVELMGSAYELGRDKWGFGKSKEV